MNEQTHIETIVSIHRCMQKTEYDDLW